MSKCTGVVIYRDVEGVAAEEPCPCEAFDLFTCPTWGTRREMCAYHGLQTRTKVTKERDAQRTKDLDTIVRHVRGIYSRWIITLTARRKATEAECDVFGDLPEEVSHD